MTEDRRTPFTVGDERTTLLDFLDYLRESVIRKATGLSEDESRRPMVPSGTSLLGLVKHLTAVELFWFQFTFAGMHDVRFPKGDFAPLPGETTDDLVAAYREATKRNNEIVLACDDLGRLAARATDKGHLSLRWVLVHMIEETARHAGHADIIRELIDGHVGR